MAFHCSKYLQATNFDTFLCMKAVVSFWKWTVFHIVSMITLAGMERNWTARGMPAANQIPSPLPRAHPRTQWTVIRSGTTHIFPIQTASRAAGVSLTRSPHPCVIGWHLSIIRVTAGGNAWKLIARNILHNERTHRTVRTLQKSTRLCVRENLSLQRSVHLS